VKDTSTDSNSHINKEKEMPEFRKLFTALAGVALFAGLASAQVGTPTGGATGQVFTCGVTNGAVTPTLRAEGYTELVGDIVLICSGGPVAAPGSLIPTANITVFLNTVVTSRLLSTTNLGNGIPSEALLLVDEPGSSVTGYGPSVPQTVCAVAGVQTPGQGAGAGGCQEYVGTIGANVGVPVAGLNGTTPGANVFQGIVQGNQVTFEGIPVLAPATAGLTRVYRITNIRSNANQVTAGAATPGSVTASLSINSSTSLTITNSTLTVGFVQQGLSSTGSGFRNSANTGTSGGATLAQCSSVSIGSTTAAIGGIQFQENFATAFKVRQSAVPQNVPGFIYNSESGFVQNAVSNLNTGTGTTSVAGLADYGTRLKATFNNVPAGVSLWVTTRDVTNNFSPANAAGYAGQQAQLVISETASDGGQSVPAVVPAAAQTAIFGFPTAGGGDPIAPVAINAATGSGTAVWEIVATNPNQIDTVNFGLFLAYSANAASNSPAPGAITVTLSYAPTPSGGAFTSTTGAAASSSLTIPRFSDSLDIGPKNIGVVSLCTTAMLFPYVINVNGFDTGIAIANTTSDPFGTAAQNGTCSLNFYGSGAPTATGTNPFTTPNVATGTDYVNLASTLAPGFSGYMIAVCNFQFAHGFAFVSDVGARNLAMGYLPLIINNGTITRNVGTSESLNQ
jgi:hypothetical protein